MLLNALDSTRYYVGSYARDARLRPSRLSKKTFDHGRPLPGGSGGHGPPPSSARTSLASGGSWCTVGAKVSVPRSVFAARQPPKYAASSQDAFFPDGATSHTKKSSTQIWGTPSFGAQKLPFNVPLTVLKLAVRILQILNFADIPGMSTSSIMSFHNSAPKLVH